MADSKISTLAAITTLADTDEMIVANSGASKKITGANLRNYLSSERAKITAGNYTTTSASFVDVDATNLSLTITTGARRVLVVVTAFAHMSSTSQDMAMDIKIDGTREGGTFGLAGASLGNLSADMNMSWSYVTDVLSAASHTFKLEWLVTGGTGTLYASATAPLTFSVVELA